MHRTLYGDHTEAPSCPRKARARALNQQKTQLIIKKINDKTLPYVTGYYYLCSAKCQ